MTEFRWIWVSLLVKSSKNMAQNTQETFSSARHESFSQYHHTIMAKLTNQFQRNRLITSSSDKHLTWLWRWLPPRLSKCQSPTTVLFRTTLTRTITLYELPILLGSNHSQSKIILVFRWRHSPTRPILRYCLVVGPEKANFTDFENS